MMQTIRRLACKLSFHKLVVVRHGDPGFVPLSPHDKKAYTECAWCGGEFTYAFPFGAGEP